eukprot:GHVP01055734.1.p1 GENE.GHVP01055734.1~~GHVP01055734.1.p1  ORF type:complete len:370 (+),score=69.48 GHVP01055734.1:124-1233(+)
MLSIPTFDVLADAGSEIAMSILKSFDAYGGSISHSSSSTERTILSNLTKCLTKLLHHQKSIGWFAVEPEKDDEDPVLGASYFVPLRKTVRALRLDMDIDHELRKAKEESKEPKSKKSKKREDDDEDQDDDDDEDENEVERRAYELRKAKRLAKQKEKPSELSSIAALANEEYVPFVIALLGHVQVGLEDPKLQRSCLLLFKKILRGRLTSSTFEDALTRCSQQVRRILSSTSDSRTANLASRILVDYLSVFQEHEDSEWIQSDLITWLINTLKVTNETSCRAQLCRLLSHFVSIRPPSAFASKEGFAVLLICCYFFAIEEDQKVRSAFKEVLLFSWIDKQRCTEQILEKYLVIKKLFQRRKTKKGDISE